MTARACLWIPLEDASSAAALWTSLVDGSRVLREVELRGAEGEVTRMIELELAGAAFQIMGAPRHEEPTMAASISVTLPGQAEIDRLWDGLLAEGGRELACGWIVDPFGIHWQVVPEAFEEAMASGDEAARQAAAEAIWGMVRIDDAAVRRAIAAAGA